MILSPPHLTPRLHMIADLTLSCDTMADIGTDHAYLPVYLCMNGICKRAVASDIRKGPLERAKTTISKYSMEGSVAVRLGSGAETLTPGEADCIIIAGMGGLMIAEILKASPSIFSSATQILIQPMTAADDLRKFLLENGYEITGEYLAKENKKLYNIISVRTSNKSQRYTPLEIYLGKKLMETTPDHFDEYFQNRRQKLKRTISGLKLASDSSLKQKLADLQEILQEMDNIGL